MPHNPQATYTEGQVISTITVLTAHHKGYQDFMACAVSSQDEVPTMVNHNLFEISPFYINTEAPSYIIIFTQLRNVSKLTD